MGNVGVVRNVFFRRFYVGLHGAVGEIATGSDRVYRVGLVVFGGTDVFGGLEVGTFLNWADGGAIVGFRGGLVGAERSVLRGPDVPLFGDF